MKNTEKYARKCDITGKGMNDGWCWGDGAFYTATKEDTLKECRKDRDSILFDLESFDDPDNLQDPNEFEEFNEALNRAKEGKESDEDLLIIGYQTGYLYYTEWWDDLEDLTDSYYTADGEEIIL